MPFLIILIGFVFLIYVISRVLKKTKSRKEKRLYRYGFAIVMGVLASFFLVIAKNIPVGGILALLSFMSAQGSLWTLIVGAAPRPVDARRQGANDPRFMTREEALDILGLSGTPSLAEIKDAHHKLILKMHPDQGGSGYLATQINQARDILLG